MALEAPTNAPTHPDWECQNDELGARTLLGTVFEATSNKCLTSSNKKLLETSASLLGARSY